jgi:hypothetical protein
MEKLMSMIVLCAREIDKWMEFFGESKTMRVRLMKEKLSPTNWHLMNMIECCFNKLSNFGIVLLAFYRVDFDSDSIQTHPRNYFINYFNRLQH